MKRPWQVWLTFGVCALIVVATMGWFSSHAILGDKLRQQAEHSMQREQQINLALWRMDTKLAPLIAEEAARPHYHYDSFVNSSPQSPSLNASPLLQQNYNVKLNFDNSIATNQWTSPQVPDQRLTGIANAWGLSSEQIAENRRRLDELAEQIDPQTLLERLPEQEVPKSPASLSTAPEDLLADNQGGSPPEEFNLDDPFGPAPNSDIDQQQIALPQVRSAKGSKLAQQSDYSQRGSRFQGLVQQEFVKQRGGNSYEAARGGYGAGSGREFGGNDSGFNHGSRNQPTNVTEGLSKPLWINGELLLARRIVRDGQPGVQGSWLDWPNLKTDLLAEVTDLLPGADLRPLTQNREGNPARMLAGLPVELVVPHQKAIFMPSPTIQWSLGLGWLALLIALFAVAGLLWGVLALSERRAAFVSSVTHELRTPLTTFRMYADMLARDMVPDAQRRQEYLTTLQREAERLTHLVENVLSYARLERGRGVGHRETITIEDLLLRQRARLTDRASQADMQLELHIDQDLGQAEVTTDVSVVEQILFNLVDNAAKYAAEAEDRRIELRVSQENQHVSLAVRDHGPGFDKTRTARNPRPFSKSAEEAAITKPGVGLGLALCRRLASQLDGRLEVETSSSGATVTLRLPQE